MTGTRSGFSLGSPNRESTPAPAPTPTPAPAPAQSGSGFLSGITDAIGGGARVSSGYRSNEEQDALHQQGATRLRGGESAHNRGSAEQPGAVDIVGIPGGNPRQVEALLRQRGYRVRSVVWERGGRNQGTGAHYHVEFEDGTSSNLPAADNSPGAAPTPITIPDTTIIQATDAERQQMQQPSEYRTDPFSAGFLQALGTAQDEQTARLNAATATLDRVTAESSAIRGQQAEQLAQTVAVKRAINDQTREHLDDLATLVEPVFQRQEQIARQLLHLEEMNPVEQGLRSLFDPNYNRRALQAEQRQQAAAVEILNNVFDQRFRHGQLLSQLAAADQADSAALADLMLQNGGEDVRLALQSFTLAQATTGNLMSQLDQESAVIVARQQRREDVLAGLSPGQVNTALAEAQSNPTGEVMVNGVPLRVGELQQQQLHHQQQALTLSNLELAIQQGNADLIERNQQAVLATMSIADVQSAIQNNGVFRGVAFDLVDLAGRLQSLQQSQALIVQQQQIDSAPQAFRSMMQQLTGAHTAAAQRFRGLTGAIPGTLTQFSGVMTSAANQFAEGIRTATAQGTLNEYLVSSMPQLQALIEQQQTVISDAVSQWAGGNDTLEAIGTAWMNGQPIEPGLAIDGMIHFERNGLPAGTTFDGASAEMMRIVREEVRLADNPAQAQRASGGQAPTIQEIIGSSSSGSQREREQRLRQRIAKRMGEAYANSMSREMFAAIPAIARDANLPFSRIDAAAWNNAVNSGDRAGWDATAAEAALTRDDFMAMIQEGPGGDRWREFSAGESGARASFDYWAQTLTANQTTALFRYIDSNFAQTGFTPSYELNRVLNSQQFLESAGNGEVGMANSSLGGFLARSAAEGNFTQNAREMARLMSGTYATYREGVTNSRRRQVTALTRDPLERARFLLMAMPDLTPAQETALLSHFRQRIAPQLQQQQDARAAADLGGTFDSGNVASGADYAVEANRIIDSIVAQGSTGDPQIDGILRRIRPTWSNLAGPMTQATNRYAAHSDGN